MNQSLSVFKPWKEIQAGQKQHVIVLFCVLLGSYPISIGNARGIDSEFRILSQAPHHVQVIENGSSSLYLRLKLIDKAKESIELESFKYAPDRSGRLLMQALIDKAKEGVNVRILLDYYGAVKKSGFHKKYARFLIAAGVKVRFYNPSSVIRPNRLLYRNHRKTLIIDGQEFLIGGRNQLDRFFELDPELNRFDREVYVTGPIAKSVQTTFDHFWHSKFTRQIATATNKKSEPMSNSATPGHDSQRNTDHLNVHRDARFVTINDDDKHLVNRIVKLGAPIINTTPVFIVHSLEYISDTPNFSDRGKVKSIVYSLLAKAEDNILIESLFFIPQRNERTIFTKLLRSGVSVSVLTNSLYASTDHLSMKMGYNQSADLIEHGLKLYAYHGSSPTQKAFLTDESVHSRWSIHSKTIVIDQRHAIEGSFNFSPRAGNFDAEHIMVFYDSPELAKLVEGQFRSRVEGAKQVEGNNRFIDGTKLNVDLTITQKVVTLFSAFLFRPFISVL